MDNELKVIIIVLAVIISTLIFGWAIGGIHLNYLREEAPKRLLEYDFDKCIYDGYQRTILSKGFGGTVCYLCQKDGIYYEVGFGRTINVAKPLQMYGPDQKTTFPSQFNITN